MNTRRFLPKVPVKKEKIQDEPVEAVVPAVAVRAKHDRRGDSRTNNGGGERKKYVPPSGDSFFTGNSTGLEKVKSSKPTNGPSHGSSSSGKDSGRSTSNNNSNNDRTSSSSNNFTTNQSVPMEIDIAKNNTPGVKTLNRATGSSEKFIDRHYDENYESSDVDDDGEGCRDNGELDQQSNVDNHETWPPESYDTSAPVSLPLGPRSITKREADLLAPIVPSKDEDKLFLVQLPTDITIRKTKKSSSDSKGNDTTEVQEAPGHAGKLLVRKSGKVEFVDKYGRHFDVTNGMTPYFMQLLVNIDTPKAIDITDSQTAASNEAQAAEALHTLAGSKNTSSNSNTHANTNTSSRSDHGSFSILSQIDRKLVFTPAYDIGINRNPNNKANYGYSIPGLNSGQQVSIDNAIMTTKANLTNSRKDMARTELNRKINKKEVYEVVTKDIDLPLPARQRSDTSQSYYSVDDDDYEMNFKAVTHSGSDL